MSEGGSGVDGPCPLSSFVLSVQTCWVIYRLPEYSVVGCPVVDIRDLQIRVQVRD